MNLQIAGDLSGIGIRVNETKFLFDWDWNINVILCRCSLGIFYGLDHLGLRSDTRRVADLKLWTLPCHSASVMLLVVLRHDPGSLIEPENKNRYSRSLLLLNALQRFQNGCLHQFRVKCRSTSMSQNFSRRNSLNYYRVSNCTVAEIGHSEWFLKGLKKKMTAKLERKKTSCEAREIDPDRDFSHPFNFSLVWYVAPLSSGSR